MTPEQEELHEDWVQLTEQDEPAPGAYDPFDFGQGGIRTRPLDWTDDPQ